MYIINFAVTAKRPIFGFHPLNIKMLQKGKFQINCTTLRANNRLLYLYTFNKITTLHWTTEHSRLETCFAKIAPFEWVTYNWEEIIQSYFSTAELLNGCNRTRIFRLNKTNSNTADRFGTIKSRSAARLKNLSVRDHLKAVF